METTFTQRRKVRNRLHVGKGALEIKEATIAGLLRELSVRYGESFENMFFDPQSGAVSVQVAILVNGRHYSHLPDGSERDAEGRGRCGPFPTYSRRLNWPKAATGREGYWRLD